LATGKQAHIESVRNIKIELLAALAGMDYCLDWKQEPEEWSARELVYHVLDTPPGGAHRLVKGIISGETSEYELWSDLTNMTSERAAYDLDQVNADIETFFQSLEDSLSGISDADLETKKVLMHQRTSKVDEERTIDAILERTLNVHIKEHLAQLQELRDALAI